MRWLESAQRAHCASVATRTSPPPTSTAVLTIGERSDPFTPSSRLILRPTSSGVSVTVPASNTADKSDFYDNQPAQQLVDQLQSERFNLFLRPRYFVASIPKLYSCPAFRVRFNKHRNMGNLGNTFGLLSPLDVRRYPAGSWWRPGGASFYLHSSSHMNNKNSERMRLLFSETLVSLFIFMSCTSIFAEGDALERSDCFIVLKQRKWKYVSFECIKITLELK